MPAITIDPRAAERAGDPWDFTVTIGGVAYPTREPPLAAYVDLVGGVGGGVAAALAFARVLLPAGVADRMAAADVVAVVTAACRYFADRAVRLA